MNEFQLPTLRRTILATGIAFAVALAVLFAAVLPAEYGVDPAGIGGALGLQQLGEGPELEVPGQPNVTIIPERTYAVSFPTQTRLVHEQDGSLAAGESARLDWKVGKQNVTELRAVLSWIDDDIAGQPTDPDTFELQLTAPQGDPRDWLGRNEGPAGSLEARYILQRAPANANLTATNPSAAEQALRNNYPPDTSGSGNWSALLRLREAGGLGPIPDEGNDWNIRIFATTYQASIGAATPTGIQILESEIVIPALSGVEFKVKAHEGESFEYDWHATGALTYDFHGQRADSREFSHERATATARTDAFVVPFTGKHGWFWQNDSAREITLNLRLIGAFEPL